ncbi:similar to Saccharomyces cerevisiae YJR030C Putative protein of unknown function [Maudiozyma saulgeensis]|uniref:Uncharacterized protein n=1 Tax=Maudiozyma saulgeensis TaxID=1789683 RepID=A0A1X7R144_9SACH|nr:similar to Saccharomyces cerevisiae YJR030C Putative protein of unknown function [Kazachstania saulgeensis]
MHLENLKKQEEENLIKLRKLISITDPFNIPSKSQLDPYSSIRKSVSILRGQIKCLIEKYVIYLQSLNSYETQSAAIEIWLFSINAVGIFNTLLLESIHLILNSNLNMFREGLNLNFTTYILNIYSQLLFYKELLAGVHKSKLENVISNFENYFKKVYMIENYSITKYDEVRDLLSKKHNLVASLRISNDDIVRKGYFRMTMNSLYKFSQLVELYQLKNGNIAIFKVNSSELPTSIGLPKQFVHRLVQGEYQLLHLGRSLLFPIIRQYDLKISQELHCGYELKTTTGNGTELRLTSVDPIQWDTHWRLCFEKLFNVDGSVVSPFKADMDRVVRKPSSSSLNFKGKYDKLKNNPFIDDDNVTGLGIEFTSSVEVPPEETTKNDNISRKSSGFSLHKSNPLPKSTDLSAIANRSLSTNPFKEPIIDNQIIQPNTELDIVSVELRKSLSPAIATTNGNYSVISKVKQNENDFDVDNNLSSNLLKGGVEVLNGKAIDGSENSLNLKHNLENGVYDMNHNNGSALQSKKQSRLETADIKTLYKSGLPSSVPNTNLFEEYLHTFLNSSYLPLFENTNSRVSFWNGTTWEVPVMDEKMQLTIISIDNNSPLLFYHKMTDIHSCTLALLLTTQCKTGRSTAQDIQLRVPDSSILYGSIKNSTIINIRTPHAEGLLEVIKNCISGKIIVSHSIGAGISSDVFSKSQNNNALQNHRNVLVSNTKVKLHILKDFRWYPVSIGRITITDETGENYKHERVLIFIFIDSKKQIKFSSIDYHIDRLGNTGISLTNAQEGKLLEFTNQSVTNEVYNLIE